MEKVSSLRGGIALKFHRWVGILAILTLLAPDAALAANRFWAGNYTNSDRWELPANWSATVNGSGGAGVPTTSDIAIFTTGTGSKSVRIRSHAHVSGLLMTASWTGSINMGTGTLNAGSVGVKVASGRLIGGVGHLNSRGVFTQTGGIVQTLQGQLAVSGTILVRLKKTANVFASTGTILMDGNATQHFNVGSGTNVNVKLNNLTLQNTGATTADSIVASGSGGINLSGSLLVTLGNMDLSTRSAPLVVDTNITIANASEATFQTNSNMTVAGNISTGASGDFAVSGDTTLTMNGGTQTLDVNGAKINNVTIGSSTSTTLGSNMVVPGTLTVNAGSALAFGAFKIYATGSLIANSGTLTQNTGALTHTGSSFSFTGSNFEGVNTFDVCNSVYLTLTDSDGNTNGTSLDTLSVAVSTGGGDRETVTLEETAVASGIFRSYIQTIYGPIATNDGKLNATGEVNADVLYTDAQDGFTNSDTATFGLGSCVSSTTSTSGGGGGGGGGSRSPGAKTVTTTPKTPPATTGTPPVSTPKMTMPTVSQARKEAREKAKQKRLERAAKRKAKRGIK